MYCIPEALKLCDVLMLGYMLAASLPPWDLAGQSSSASALTVTHLGAYCHACTFSCCCACYLHLRQYHTLHLGTRVTVLCSRPLGSWPASTVPIGLTTTAGSTCPGSGSGSSEVKILTQPVLTVVGPDTDSLCADAPTKTLRYQVTRTHQESRALSPQPSVSRAAMAQRSQASLA